MFNLNYYLKVNVTTTDELNENNLQPSCECTQFAVSSASVYADHYTTLYRLHVLNIRLHLETIHMFVSV